MKHWFKTVGQPLGDEDPNGPVSQADGDPAPLTRLEPYPRLLSVQQDEMLYHNKMQIEMLRQRIELLEVDVARLEAKK